jgi:ubiquinone/menaquinone biosynthesis C-methylase UbiE
LLSADPMPNSPDDIVAQLRIWNKNLYKDVTSLRAAAKKHLHPLFIRNEISEFLLLIDKEEDWVRHEVPVEFELSDEERIIYNSVLWDEDIPTTVKMQLLYLCVLNPGLFSASKEVESSLLNECFDLTRKSFKEGHNSIVIVENKLKQGVTRDHIKRGGESILKKLKKEFGDDVEIIFLDGDVTNKDERKDITDAMKTKSDKKQIFLVNGDIIREGINLSAISRCIMLDPTFNKADTVQLLKRFAREGNKEAKLYSLCVMGTIMEAIRQHADVKYIRTQIVKYGGTLTEDDYALLEEEIFNEKIKLDDEFVLISSYVKDHTLTERQKMAIVMSKLFRDKKVEEVEESLEKFGKYIAERYMIDWESSPSGNNARMVCGLVKDLEDEGIITGDRFLDVACGPLILENTLGQIDDGKKRSIHSLDINSHMINLGKTVLNKFNQKAKPRVKIGRMNDLSVYSDESFDVVNNALAFDYTKLNNNISKNFQNDQRVQTLMEFNRVLKEDGIAIITLPPNTIPTEKLLKAIEKHFGFEILKKYTGRGVSTDKKEIDTFRNNTIVLKKVGKPDITGIVLKDLELLRATITRSSIIRDKDEEKPKEMPNRCAHDEFAIRQFKFQLSEGKSSKGKVSTKAIQQYPRSKQEKAKEERKEKDKRDRNDKIRLSIREVRDKFKGAFPVEEQRKIENELDIVFSYSDSPIPTWFRYSDVKCLPDEVKWYSVE